MSSHIFDSLRTLKVLVVPVGENSLFDAHFDLISGIKYVTKEEIQPAFSSKGNTNAAFKDFKWCDGNVVFEYLRYDVDMGTSSGDYVDVSWSLVCDNAQRHAILVLVITGRCKLSPSRVPSG